MKCKIVIATMSLTSFICADVVETLNTVSMAIDLVRKTGVVGMYVKESINPSIETQLDNKITGRQLEILRAEAKLDECFVENALFDEKDIFTCKCAQKYQDFACAAGFESLNAKREEFVLAMKKFREHEEIRQKQPSTIQRVFSGLGTAWTVAVYVSAAAIILNSVFDPGVLIENAQKIVSQTTSVGAKVVAVGAVASSADMTLDGVGILGALIYKTEAEQLKYEEAEKAKRGSLYARIATKYAVDSQKNNNSK